MTRDSITANNVFVNFNSHAHVERDVGTQYGLIREFNFNSHAHVERDQSAIVKLDDLVISTHTLTWSVTVSRIILIFY